MKAVKEPRLSWRPSRKEWEVGGVESRLRGLPDRYQATTRQPTVASDRPHRSWGGGAEVGSSRSYIQV